MGPIKTYIVNVVKKSNLFDWKKSTGNNDDNMKSRYSQDSAAQVDYTAGFPVNKALTQGIYRNTYPGLKLAGFGSRIIDTPVSFMGLPIVEIPDDLVTQEILQNVVIKNTMKIKGNHTQSHRDGTNWIYPEYRESGLNWKFIGDDLIPDNAIIRDIDTGEMIKLTTLEKIKFNTDASTTEFTVTKQTIYTVDRVVTKYVEGDVPPGVVNTDVINTAGVLPIPFANNGDVNEIRGYSDFEKVLSILKSYHDVAYAEATDLARFRTKMVQQVKDSDKWKSNNGITDMATYDIGAVSFVMNLPDEKTEFEIPEKIVTGYETALKRLFRMMVEISGLPELVWGLVATGNHATAEENMAMLMQYVRDKQQQKVDPYNQLLQASARLMALAREIPEVVDLRVTWDVLDSTSAKTKAEVFKAWAEGISKLVAGASVTLEQLYRMWKESFPGVTDEGFEEWEKGIGKMVAHTVSVKATPVELLDLQGLKDDK